MFLIIFTYELIKNCKENKQKIRKENRIFRLAQNPIQTQKNKFFGEPDV